VIAQIVLTPILSAWPVLAAPFIQLSRLTLPRNSHLFYLPQPLPPAWCQCMPRVCKCIRSCIIIFRVAIEHCEPRRSLRDKDGWCTMFGKCELVHWQPNKSRWCIVFERYRKFVLPWVSATEIYMLDCFRGWVEARGQRCKLDSRLTPSDNLAIRARYQQSAAEQTNDGLADCWSSG
jgi:hypothetical protein